VRRCPPPLRPLQGRFDPGFSGLEIVKRRGGEFHPTFGVLAKGFDLGLRGGKFPSFQECRSVVIKADLLCHLLSLRGEGGDFEGPLGIGQFDAKFSGRLSCSAFRAAPLWF